MVVPGSLSQAPYGARAARCSLMSLVLPKGSDQHVEGRLCVTEDIIGFPCWMIIGLSFDVRPTKVREA